MESHNNTSSPSEANFLSDWMPPDASRSSRSPGAEDHVNGSARNSHRSPSPPGDRHDFEIAVICALPLEARTVSALFDKKWSGKGYGKAAGDTNAYSLGLVGHHNVVLVHMPNMGKVAAASAAAGLRASFQRISLALVVGICGGAPLGKHHNDIFLGDVVVSEGIIQYDFGRRFPNNRFERKDTPQDNLPRPNPEIRATLKLQADHGCLQDKISGHLRALRQQLGAAVTYPGASEDRLFKSTYQHKHYEASECASCSGDEGSGNVCDAALRLSCEQLGCDQQELISRIRSARPLAEPAEWRPAVHFGLFASGDTVMKSGEDRDVIVARDGVIAFEMEGAGVWESLPGTLIIKGICDYADSHKSKKWQPYAAATATAATRAFLEEWSITSSERPSPRQPDMYPQREEEAPKNPTLNAKQIKILRKLYTSPYEDRKDRNPRRTEGTCEWFVANKLFREWQENKGSTTLWVSADPGCGKSVLDRHLIDSVLPNTASRTTCYFFFKDDFEDQKSVVSALCCILHQLFKQNRFLLSEVVLEQFEIYTEDITGSFSKLWSVLLSAAMEDRAGEIVCILDAVDECEDPGRSQLAHALYTLYQKNEASNLKFLLTSRPYISIRQGFKPSDISKLAIIHLSGESDIEMTKISKEIDVFIQAKVQVVKEKLKLSNSEGDLLLQELMRIPNRTYLWVHLTLDLIENNLDLDKMGIIKVISHLPKTVEEAYERILSRSLDLEKAKKLLHIVVAAARPLTLSEMNLALTLRNEHRSFSDFELKSEARFRENVRDLCGLFVVIISQKIYLLHQTAKEFLVQNDQANASGNTHIYHKWKHSLSPQESHRILSEICIWHLLFAEFAGDFLDETGMIPQNSDEYIFLDYSAKHWTTHLRESRIEVDNSLIPSILRLCDATSKSCKSWLRIYWSTTDTDPPLNFTSLMIASYFGLTMVMKLLYKLEGTDINLKDVTYRRSALSWAAGNGFHDAVKLLIKGNSRWRGIKLPFKVGAQVDSMDRDGLTPLSHAILNSHITSTRLLLKAGARVDKEDGIGGTPLSYAICNGHESIVELVFKRGTSASSEGDISVPLLFSAASMGHEDIMKLLLDRGRVNPNSKDKHGETPLSLAINNHHRPIIKLLLENPGDEIKVTKEAVIAAATNQNFGKEVMVSLLKLQGSHISFTEDTVLAIIKQFFFDEEVIFLLLNQHGDQISITGEVMSIITGHSDTEVDILFLVQDRYQVTITDKVVSKILDNEVVTLILGRNQGQIFITKEALPRGVEQFDKEVIVLLLDQHRDQVTDAVPRLVTSVDNQAMTLLLGPPEVRATFTDEALLMIINRFDEEVVTLLLNQHGSRLAMTEEDGTAMVERFGEELITSLLDRHNTHIVFLLKIGSKLRQKIG